jgi:tetratricopeptide (TPR) repeat protein
MRARLYPITPHIVALLLLGAWTAAAASPSMWDDATRSTEDRNRSDRFQRAMQSGFEFARNAIAAEIARANGEEILTNRRELDTRNAIAAFTAATQLEPSDPEAYYYLAVVRTELQLDCKELCSFDPKIASEALAAIDAFEERAPLDPRLANLMNRRAIYHTRLAGETKGEVAHAHLEKALAAYRVTLDRYLSPRVNTELVYGNMAETMMMLGDVEGAIEYYRQAQRQRPSTSISLGLAVALDRDERGTEARALLRDVGADAIGNWEAAVHEGDIFYVPAGEVEYYRALINESFGNYEAAIANYTTFIQTRAHPQFSTRAAANRDALRARRQ